MRVKTEVIRRLTFIFGLSLLALSGLAQSPSATVVGRVTDPSGAVVPGVAVRVTEVDTNLVHLASTNTAGDFTLPYLNPGRHTLEASQLPRSCVWISRSRWVLRQKASLSTMPLRRSIPKVQRVVK